MAKYVDGFVIPIKKSKVKDYKKIAILGRKLWMEHGALDYYECIGADLKNKWGTPFPKLCKLKSNETLIFAFVVYKSKAHRKSVNTKVMKDARMAAVGPVMPFDMKRFTSGIFEVLVST